MKIITCKEAKAQSKVKYFTGKPCPKGHVSERFVSTRGCEECVLAKSRVWQKENPEKAKACKKSYRDANPEKHKAWKSESQKRNRDSANRRNRKYAEANKEILAVKTAEWGRNNRGKRAATAAKYRAAKLQATPPWADFGMIEQVYDLAQRCKSIKGFSPEVDHIIPLQGDNVCGLHVQGNFQIIDMKHNRIKGKQFKEAYHGL